MTGSEARGDTPTLSAVVLGYRAGEALIPVVGALYDELVESGVAFELVLVANYWPGRGDDTPAVAERFAAEHPLVRLVCRPKEGGMGWDMRDGLAAARGSCIIVIDGDAQNPIGDVLRLFEHMRTTNAPVGKGRRVSRGDGAYRSFVSVVYNTLFCLLFRTWGLWDINGKPKGMTRDAYARIAPMLRSNDWFTDAEIILVAKRLGLRIEELPVKFLDSTRPSLVGPVTILEFIANMLRYRIRGNAGG